MTGDVWGTTLAPNVRQYDYSFPLNLVNDSSLLGISKRDILDKKLNKYRAMFTHTTLALNVGKFASHKMFNFLVIPSQSTWYSTYTSSLFRILDKKFNKLPLMFTGAQRGAIWFLLRKWVGTTLH